MQFDKCQMNTTKQRRCLHHQFINPKTNKMKKQLLLSLMVIFSGTAMAQPTLTAATNNPVVGDVNTVYDCDTSGYSGVLAGGASGAGVTWNYGELIPLSSQVNSVVSVIGSLYIDSFPSSNLLTISEDGFGDATYFYDNANASNLELTGIYDSSGPGANEAEYFQEPFVMMSYPVVYNTITLDTALLSVPMYGEFETRTDSTIVDGYGTLTTPTGTYTNVLRIHTIYYTSDSIPGSVQSVVRSEEYDWFVAGTHGPILEVDYDTSSGVSYISDIQYQLPSPTGIAQVNNDEVTISVSPNPATDVINIKLNLKEIQNTAITLSDVSGRVVGNINTAGITTGASEIKYPVADLPSGVYIIHMTNGAQNTAKKIVVVR